MALAERASNSSSPSAALDGGDGSGSGQDPGVETLHTAAWVIAGAFCLVACSVSLHLIWTHLKHFTRPVQQRKIVGILWIVPIFAINSWLSLRFPHAAVYLDMVRDCYEAYVLWLFLALMVSYLSNGDELALHERMEQLPPVPHAPPVSCCYKRPVPLDAEFLRWCKRGTMQFVVLKPTLTLVAVILETQGLYDQGVFRADRGYMYVSFLENASVSYAFYVLALFYMGLKSELKPYKPVPKFLCVKVILFMSFWQGVFIAFLSRLHWVHELGSYTTENVSTGIQNLALCVEMFLAGLAHRWAFPCEDAAGSSSSSSRSGGGASSQYATLAADEAPPDSGGGGGRGRGGGGGGGGGRSSSAGAAGAASSSVAARRQERRRSHGRAKLGGGGSGGGGGEGNDTTYRPPAAVAASGTRAAAAGAGGGSGSSGSGKPSSSSSSFLQDNLAIGDALNDFNEVSPVVLPTGFRPGNATVVDREDLEDAPEAGSGLLEGSLDVSDAATAAGQGGGDGRGGSSSAGGVSAAGTGASGAEQPQGWRL
eukprot:g412.t1